MSLLAELVAFCLPFFYRDFAPTELGTFFPLKAIKDFAPTELLFRPSCLMSSCSAPGTALLSAERRARRREAIPGLYCRHP